MRNTYQEIFASIVILFAFSAWAEKPEFNRYQTIVDRQMFGPLPPNFDPTKSPSEVSGGRASAAAQKELSKEQEQLKSAIHFSMVNITPDGSTAVGFTDSSDPKVPVHYYLKVGEERGGWLVKEADPVAATMTIAKGDVEVSLKIGGNSAKDKEATAKAGGRRGATVGRHPSLFGSGVIGSPSSLSGSRRNKRLLRKQEEFKKIEAEFLKKEEAANARRERERVEQAAQQEEVHRQLFQIQESLRRASEEKNKQAPEPDNDRSEKHGNDNAEN